MTNRVLRFVRNDPQGSVRMGAGVAMVVTFAVAFLGALVYLNALLY